MEGNRDESEKCVRIALKASAAGDREKAIKFLQKAHKLYPSRKVEELIERMQNVSDSSESSDSGSQHSSSNEQSRPADSSPLRQRRNSASRQQAASGGTSSNGDAHKDYTPEQQAAVRKIQQCKNFYEILGVTKDCSEADVKKAYKKLALQFHPDKNKAPGSEEAFKAIGKAFAVLSDKEKRKKYDMYGDESQNERQMNRHSHRHHYYNNGWYYETRGFDDDDISPEDIFNMFFNGGFPSSHVRRRQAFHHAHSERRAGETNYTFLIQVLPILLLVVMSLFSSMFVGDPIFRLSRQGAYKEERRTPNDVMYYVKRGFEKEYSGRIHLVEKEVDEEYIMMLRRNCYDEKYKRERVIQQARYFGDRKMFESGKKMKTPSCDKYNTMYDKIAGG
ncbi:dnaJ homolog subfamily B member 12-like [Diadema antillarum]|uniref:dnaJ homolog subfamily B member 12-like n=1 Tax=Diadema antillarum TaxID=105358 RepID=UPI003A864D2F